MWRVLLRERRKSNVHGAFLQLEHEKVSTALVHSQKPQRVEKLPRIWCFERLNQNVLGIPLICDMISKQNELVWVGLICEMEGSRYCDMFVRGRWIWTALSGLYCRG